MNPWLIAAAFFAGAIGSWQVQEWRHDANERDRMEQEAKEEGIKAQRVDTASVAHEADKHAIQTEFKVITETVEKIVEKPVYRDMCLDDDGLRVLRSAIHPTPSEPTGAVSRSGGTR